MVPDVHLLATGPLPDLRTWILAQVAVNANRV